MNWSVRPWLLHLVVFLLVLVWADFPARGTPLDWLAGVLLLVAGLALAAWQRGKNTYWFVLGCGAAAFGVLELFFEGNWTAAALVSSGYFVSDMRPKDQNAGDESSPAGAA